MKTINQAIEAKKASIKLATAATAEKNKALNKIASALEKNKEKIIQENKKDIKEAKNISKSLIKRLKLDEIKLDELIDGIKDLIKLEDPVGKTLEAKELDKDLELFKVTCPIGVIGVIFESRPDALVQIATLCLKSGNAVILKGGKEAKHSNKILFEIIKNSSTLSTGWIQLIETREEVKEILKLDKYINLLIPRGSNKFVKYIQDNTKIPVLGHSEGICHVYVDKEANINKAVKLSYDSKCQYSAVCNAMETLLVHKDIAGKFLPLIKKEYDKANVELRGDEKTLKLIKIKKAEENDWKTEYNDLILSIKIVNAGDEAINHINNYGSGHTDAIVTENKKTALKFLSLVDSSSVFWNASTRFSDGYRYGFGAEVGISTNKIHARGPVGLEGLVIYKYILVGKDQIVKDYTGKHAKRFTHKRINRKW